MYLRQVAELGCTTKAHFDGHQAKHLAILLVLLLVRETFTEVPILVGGKSLFINMCSCGQNDFKSKGHLHTHFALSGE
jgi:hypothetical protein